MGNLGHSWRAINYYCQIERECSFIYIWPQLEAVATFVSSFCGLGLMVFPWNDRDWLYLIWFLSLHPVLLRFVEEISIYYIELYTQRTTNQQSNIIISRNERDGKKCLLGHSNRCYFLEFMALHTCRSERDRFCEQSYPTYIGEIKREKIGSNEPNTINWWKKARTFLCFYDLFCLLRNSTAEPFLPTAHLQWAPFKVGQIKTISCKSTNTHLYLL